MRVSALLIVGVLFGCDFTDDLATITVDDPELAGEYRMDLGASSIGFSEEPEGRFLVTSQDFDAAMDLLEAIIQKQAAPGRPVDCLRIESAGSQGARLETASDHCAGGNSEE